MMDNVCGKTGLVMQSYGMMVVMMMTQRCELSGVCYCWWSPFADAVRVVGVAAVAPSPAGVAAAVAVVVMTGVRSSSSCFRPK